MKTIQTNNYFAKSTMPANGWRSEWSDFETAMKKAKKFVADWRECGVAAKAGVFFRDGSLCAECGGNSDPNAVWRVEPDSDLNRMEHDDRGDN